MLFFYGKILLEVIYMNDEKYMRIALKEALKAFKCDEVPVGAVIVKDGKILSKAHNKKETSKQSIYHAEIIAIEKACRKVNDWRLNDCTIYVTLEPCEMCKGAIKESRIKKVVYAAKRKKEENISLEIKKISNKNINDESEMILLDFFKHKRK